MKIFLFTWLALDGPDHLDICDPSAMLERADMFQHLEVAQDVAAHLDHEDTGNRPRPVRPLRWTEGVTTIGRMPCWNAQGKLGVYLIREQQVGQ